MIHSRPTSAYPPELVAIFSALPGLRRPADRARYLPLVADELDVVLDLDFSADTRRDIDRMLSACGTVWGGIWALVEAIGLYYDGPDMTRLRTQVAQYVPEPVLLARERAPLRRLLAALTQPPGHYLRRVYRVAAPAAPPLESTPNSLLAVAEELEDQSTGPDGIASLLTFADIILHDQDSASLRQWANDLAARMRVDEGVRAMVARRAVNRLHEPAFLVARLTPGPDAEAFWLTVYLQWGSVFSDRLHTDPHPRPLATVPPVLDDLLRTRTDLRGLSLTIEFVLPADRLCEPVDEWPIGQPSYQLGHRYPVVVRPPDRLSDGHVEEVWRKKWAWVRTQGSVSDPEAVYWQPGIRGETMRSELLEELKRVCLALAEPPEPTRGDAFERLGYGLAAGVPAAFWCREPRDPLRIDAELVSRARSTPVQHHPRLALELRLESNRRDADPMHVGRRLTLLWDDYDRQPPVDLPFVLP